MSRMRSISAVVPKLTKKAFGQKATLLGRLVVSWLDIVGNMLSRQAIPAELHYQSICVNGKNIKKLIVSLYVRDGSTALELQYQTEQIIEKINTFLGYNAVHELRFIQAPEMFKNTGRRIKVKPQKVSTNEYDRIKHYIEGANIAESDLKEALQSLGESIILAGKDDK